MKKNEGGLVRIDNQKSKQPGISFGNLGQATPRSEKQDGDGDQQNEKVQIAHFNEPDDQEDPDPQKPVSSVVLEALSISTVDKSATLKKSKTGKKKKKKDDEKANQDILDENPFR